MSLTCASETEANAAYLSGAAAAQLVMQAGPAAFRPFDGPHAAQLRQQWTALHAAFHADCHWPAESVALRAEDIEHILPQAQRLVARVEADRRWEDSKKKQTWSGTTPYPYGLRPRSTWRICTPIELGKPSETLTPTHAYIPTVGTHK